MSHKTQYTAIEKMRLIDLQTLPPELLANWLATKPLWFRESIGRYLIE